MKLLITLNLAVPILLILLLTSCTKYIEIEKNVTVEVEKIVYVERNITVETIKYVNLTCNCTNITSVVVEETNSSYLMGLIKQIKRCEEWQEKYLNVTDCVDRLDKCNSTLEKIKNVTG